MRVVLDTNVIIAAFISRGVCNELLEHCVINHQVVLSDFILNETKEKLTEKFNFTAREAEDVTGLLAARCRVVCASKLDVQICADPDDDNIIGTAIAGKCDLIVTGDRKLLEVGTFASIQIVSPKQYWAHERGSGQDAGF